MKNQDFSALLLVAIQAALKAGEILRKGFGTDYEIMSKPGRQNYVTSFDKASEACIIALIKEHFPTHNILAEESGFLLSQPDNIVWIIDPLDGTTNFAHHIPFFTISIAAYYQEIGLCGVIFQPLTQELFIAEKGKGAFLNGTRMKVSRVDRLEDCLFVASFPYDLQPLPAMHVHQFLHLSELGVTFRNLGSAALSLAYIAAGKADAFWMHHLFPWDIAAGKVLIEEAGGLLIHESHTFTTYDSTSILATNGILHQPLVDYLSHIQ